MKLFFCLCLISLCLGDVYLHYPPGSNNRNRERSDLIDAASRLFESKNNPRGGYPWRGDPTLLGVPDPLVYYVGSKLIVHWSPHMECLPTSEHDCSAILQYGERFENFPRNKLCQ